MDQRQNAIVLNLDYLNFSQNKKFMDKINNQTIIYSNEIYKYNRRCKRQTRNIVITTQTLYNCDKSTIKREIPLQQIKAITINNFGNEFVLHIPEDYDYRYKSHQREIIINLLKEHIFGLFIFALNTDKLEMVVTTRIDKQKGISRMPNLVSPSSSSSSNNNNPTSTNTGGDSSTQNPSQQQLIQIQRLSSGVSPKNNNNTQASDPQQQQQNQHSQVVGEFALIQDNESIDIRDVRNSLIGGNYTPEQLQQLTQPLYNNPNCFENPQQAGSAKITIDDFNLLKVLGRGTFGKVMLAEKRSEVQQLQYQQQQQLQQLMQMQKQAGFNHQQQQQQQQSSSPTTIQATSTSTQIKPRRYAIKSIHKEDIKSEKSLQQLKMERQILEQVQSPFLVRLAFAFQTPEKVFFVMDFLEGGELFQHLRNEKGRGFSEQRTRFYVAEIFLGLTHLHQKNIIYRDLKPENVLLDAQGHICLTDFGISKITQSENTNCNSIVGTPEYLAPELIMQEGYDKHADYWGLGILCYEMMFGRPPFVSQNRSQLFAMIVMEDVKFPQSAINTISQEALDFILMLLVKDKNMRKGAEEIKNHPWMAGMEWEKLEKKQVQAPFIPHIDKLEENFDKIFICEQPIDSFVTNPTNKDLIQIDGMTYQGSVVNKNQM